MNIYRNIELQKENQTLVLSVVRSARKTIGLQVCGNGDAVLRIPNQLRQMRYRVLAANMHGIWKKSGADADANGNSGRRPVLFRWENYPVVNWKK